jgi:hypothetical protein
MGVEAKDGVISALCVMYELERLVHDITRRAGSPLEPSWPLLRSLYHCVAHHLLDPASLEVLHQRLPLRFQHLP